MQEFAPDIRSTPRAFILKADKLLVQEKRHPIKGHYYTLPGGKQDPGESLVDALHRECLEEIGAHITIDRLIHVAEVFRLKTNPVIRAHQLDFVFAASVDDGYTPQMGHHPDPSQVATLWLSTDKADMLRPSYVTNLFRRSVSSYAPLYLGCFDE
ncbi:NUDIX domain-containing protein [Roseibium hamelinense]|uniref:NUDIX domain-containing protein n=1 Tax=Roseibium hamelinense TaxID=150831 RepID=A0A562TGW7_9HYPH|nr:NUDIX domain-containing protein [Roseibium hamelinense]MTI45938.1 NUDIX domain-containing protein [Roseibium hamelinense]TWI92877.1 NUDIX domain-containing protein [Roseibium hamelinense]